MSGIIQFLLTSKVSVQADTNFKYTTLLLPGDGTNGAQNNTFLDSSTNTFSITRNGNTTQGTFSPFSQTGWSNYFDGTGDYLTVPDNAAWDLGSGNFTIESWVYPTASPNQPIIIGQWTSSYSWIMLLSNDGNRYLRGLLYDGNFNDFVSTTSLSLNAWNHCAFVRESNTVSLYLNGSRVYTTTYSGTVSASTSAVSIGADSAGSSPFTGYLSNTRVVVGTALYSGTTYTVPTAPLTAVTNTKLLTCQSNRFVDNSSNAFAITVNGNTSVQAFSPFAPTAAYSAATNGGSGYFDGTGDYLTVPHNAAFDFGSGDFTMEAWVYPTTASLTSELFDKRASAANYSQMPQIQITANQPIAYASATGSSWAVSISGSSNVKPYSWNHVALTRSGSTWTLWLNGASIGTATSSITVYASTSNVVIGAADAAGTNPMNGYIAGSRIVKGTAVYTSAFTPPTAPLTAISGTSLLLNYTNAGIYDATAKNDLETVGNAQISTTQSKFGGSSMYFDGTGDYLSIGSSPNLQFGTGDFTVEAWVYLTANQNFGTIFLSSTTGSGDSLHVQINSANKVRITNASSQFLLATNAIPLNTWTHIAVVRYGTTLTIYQDGTANGSTTNSTSFIQSGGLVGLEPVGGTYYFTGYIDDLRITKGIARYTQNFTPPTSAFLTL